MLDDNTVRHIAHLARVGIGEHEVEKFKKDLSAILDYVKELERYDVSNVSPTKAPSASGNRGREDDEKGTPLPHIIPSLLTDQSPRNANGYVRVPRIIE